MKARQPTTAYRSIPMTDWKLVPREPTEEMIEAAFERMDYDDHGDHADENNKHIAKLVHKAALDASPSPLDDDELVERLIEVYRKGYAAYDGDPGPSANRTRHGLRAILEELTGGKG